MLKPIRNRIAFAKRAAAVKKLNRPVSNNKILVIQLDAMGDAAILADYINTLLKTKYEPVVVCRKGLGKFWEKLFPGLHLFEYEMEQGLDSEFCADNFSDEYEAVISLSVIPNASYIASFPISSKRISMVSDKIHYKGSRTIFTDIVHVTSKDHIRVRFDKLFSYLDDYKETVYDFSLNNVPDRESKKIIIHPGAKWIPRRWPAGNFIELLRKLNKLQIETVLICGPDDEDIRRQFADCIDDFISLRTLDSIEDLIDTINSASIFIGNDSGPVHIANLLHKNTIVLWGPGNYERIRPIGENTEILIEDVDCRPCKQYGDKYKCERGENICLQKISVDTVLDRILYFRNKKS
ncbi:MAG: glycosyltransferase family 9 protein [Candidatus Kapabacteria bacterium]|jgi:ADP-heptose:LPS heptosyltransferase|nr:glycosyltransferase family 9 protein [Candidatus Kapabacteria bacterium]